jgi:hypothetical protein
MRNHKLNNSDALKFMFAGNSITTFVNSKTNNRFTFKVKQKKDSNLFFVSVLTSPDVYVYIGTVINSQFKHSKKSSINRDAQSVRVFDYVFTSLIKNNLPTFIEIWHEGRCGKCGRVLTVPDSILNGLGPECMKSIRKSEKADNSLQLTLA